MNYNNIQNFKKLPELKKEDLFNLKGIIYIIINTQNGMVYIGESYKSFWQRYSSKLWWETSHNNKLVNHIKYYGPQNFRIKILTSNICSKEERLKLEARFIREFGALHPNGYNFIEEGRDNGRLTEEIKNQIAFKNSKNYKLQDYTGKVHEFRNLRKFCKERNLCYAAMINMIGGVSLSSGGFGLISTSLSLIKNPVKIYRFQNLITNEIVDTETLTEFAKNNNLNYGSVCHLASGISKKLKNWVVLNGSNQIIRNNKNRQINEIFTLINLKTGEQISGKVKELAAKINGNKSGIHGLKRGRFKTYKGWVLEGGEKIKCKPKGNRYSSFTIQNTKTLEIKHFQSISDASKFLELHRQYVYKWLNNQNGNPFNHSKITDWIIIECQRS